ARRAGAVEAQLLDDGGVAVGAHRQAQHRDVRLVLQGGVARELGGHDRDRVDRRRQDERRAGDRRGADEHRGVAGVSENRVGSLSTLKPVTWLNGLKVGYENLADGDTSKATYSDVGVDVINV